MIQIGEYLSPPSIEDSFRELDERISDIVIGPPPSWQTPALENGWLNYGGGFAPAGYVRDMVGVVRLRGLIKSGTVGLNCLTLPVGFRPGFSLLFPSWTSSGAGAIKVQANGGVEVNAGANVFFGLDSVIFLAEH